MYNNSNVGLDEVGSRCRELRVGALSSDEWSYLLGLFLADGSSSVFTGERKEGGVRRNYVVTFCLSGGEEELARRVAVYLGRLGLKPFVRRFPVKDEINVVVYSKALLGFLPGKAALKSEGEVGGSRFIEEHRLLGVERGLPFLAGLLDGDGAAYIQVARRRNFFFDLVRPWNWCVCQSKFPFLVKRFVWEFVESIVSGGVKLGVDRRMRWGKMSKVFVARFRKAGILALLDEGIAKWSWKAERWLGLVAGLRAERAKYMSVKEIARILGVCERSVWKLVKASGVRCVEVGCRPRRYIHADDVERLQESVQREKERVEAIDDGGVGLRAVSMETGIPYQTLLWRIGHGKLQAIRVSEGVRRAHWVVPRDEVERLVDKEKKGKFGRRPRPMQCRVEFE